MLESLWCFTTKNINNWSKILWKCFEDWNVIEKDECVPKCNFEDNCGTPTTQFWQRRNLLCVWHTVAKSLSELHHTSDAVAVLFWRGVIHFKTIYAYRKRTSQCEYATSIKNTNLKKRRHGTRAHHSRPFFISLGRSFWIRAWKISDVVTALTIDVEKPTKFTL